MRAALRYGAITWADIKLSFKAIAHLEAGFCKQIFKELDETWAAATGGTSKRVILPLIGLWNAPSQTQWSCETVSHDEDCTFSGKVRRRALDVPGFEHVYHDLVFKTDLLSYTSMRPIGQIALDMEGVFLRQLHEAVRPMLYNRCKPYKVVGACVDCIHYQVPRKLARDIGRMLEKSCRHADGTAKYHWSEEAPPQREVSASWPVVAPRSVPALCDRPWSDYMETREVPAIELARDLILVQGQPCYICGAPGSGKTFIMKSISKELREANSPVLVGAFTNAVARLHHEGQTLHHLLHRAKSFSGWFIVDEASQIPLAIFAQLQRFRLSGARFIFVGDFANQLSAAHDYWRGAPVPELALADSLAFRGICGFNRVACTENRRCDPQLFQVFGAIPRMQVGEATSMLRARFPLTRARPDWEIVVSNAKRIKINGNRNARESAEHNGDRLEVPRERNADGQAACIFPGVRLIGRATVRGVTNGVLYEVKSVTQAGATLRELDAERLVEVRLEDMRCLALAGALTVFSAQGKTLAGRVRFHADSGHTTCRTLVVGISRATHADLIEVC